MTSNGAVLEVSFYGISEHPTEQSISIPKGLSEKELIFNLLYLYYIGKITVNKENLKFLHITTKKQKANLTRLEERTYKKKQIMKKVRHP